MFRLDSCAHPTLDGSWLGGRTGVTHEALAADLAVHGYSGALAIGLPGVGDYSHQAFFDSCAKQRGLVPVAALTAIASPDEIAAELEAIRAIGYRIVKVHPRLLGYEATLLALDDIVRACAGTGLSVALCTYPEYRSTIDPDRARAIMSAALAHNPEVPAVALHAGVLDSTPFARLIPDAAALLIDVSLALPKYPAEVSHRIAAIASEHPHSVALGSDGPEWSYEQIDAALADVSHLMEESTLRSIAGEALATWLNAVDPDLAPR